MVLWVGPMRSPCQRPDRKIEPGGAVLSFIIPIWREISNLIRLPGMFQDILDHTIDLCISPTALFIMKCPRIPNAGHNQTMLDPRSYLFVLREPGDRSNCPRDKKETIRVPQRQASQHPGETRCQRDPG